MDGMDGITASVSHHFVGPVYQSINTLPCMDLTLLFPSACSPVLPSLPERLFSPCMKEIEL